MQSEVNTGHVDARLAALEEIDRSSRFAAKLGLGGIGVGFGAIGSVFNNLPDRLVEGEGLSMVPRFTNSAVLMGVGVVLIGGAAVGHELYERGRDLINGRRQQEDIEATTS